MSLLGWWWGEQSGKQDSHGLCSLGQKWATTRARLGGSQQGRWREGRGAVLGCPRQGEVGVALTICPTQTLAASIMAPSAMERADSFSMCGFPESSSSTTCRRGRREVTAGLPRGRGAGRR